MAQKSIFEPHNQNSEATFISSTLKVEEINISSTLKVEEIKVVSEF